MPIDRQRDQSFKGFEAFWSDLRMKAKMSLYVSYFVLMVQAASNVAYFLLMDEAFVGSKIIFFKFWVAKILKVIPFICDLKIFNFFNYNISAAKYVKVFAINADWYFYKLVYFFSWSFIAWLLVPIIYWYFQRRTKNMIEEEYLKGAVVLPDNIFARKIKKMKTDVVINKYLSIPFECENRHVLAIGKPGSGKTQLISRAIENVIKRNEKAIIYDLKGDYVSEFFNPDTDILLNPLDVRSVGWCPLNEVDSVTNIEAICLSMIPIKPTQADSFWDNAARDVLFSILLFCWKNNLKTNTEIHKQTILSRDELVVSFKKTDGCDRGLRPLDESKVASSVLSCLAQYVKCFEYARYAEGDFSIRKWINNPSIKGRIFLVNYAELGAVMRPLLSLFIDLMANRVLMLSQDSSRRIFFFLDEFGTLQMLGNILNLLKLARSYGGSLWIGVQDFGQIEQIYGPNNRQTIVNACGNNFIFGVDDNTTAQTLANRIGERMLHEVGEGVSFGVMDNREGRSISERKSKEMVVMPSEIMRLADLEFFAKFACFPEFTKSKMNYKKFKIVTESFIEKKLPEYILVQEKVAFQI